MKSLICIAGSLLENPDCLNTLSRQFARLAENGDKLLIVHGDAPPAAFPHDCGCRLDPLEPRISAFDSRKRDAAVNLLSGCLSRRLVRAIFRQGWPAVSILDRSSSFYEADLLVHNGVEGSLGCLGYLTNVNEPAFASLWQKGFIPVVSPFAMARNGELCLIDPDHMAAACAEYLRTDQLIYLTPPGSPFPCKKALRQLTCEKIDSIFERHLLDNATLRKLEAAKRALLGGVRNVCIVSVAATDSLLKILAGKPPDDFLGGFFLQPNTLAAG